jgi:hypothetical protein
MVGCSLPLLASATRAQDADTSTSSKSPLDSTLHAGNFHFSAGARAALIDLWQNSTNARSERVACLGGYRQAAITYLTRVEPITDQEADSMHVQAVASIEQCRPPRWLGTVHTHIAKYNGVIPYATFSGADRGVIAQWHRTWNTEGVFCILYSDVQAHCESGDDRSGDALYARRYGSGPPSP